MIGGVDRLPVRAGALVVVNTRRWSLAPIQAALAITRETGRVARFVGRPDTAPIGALARRLGGLLARPDEVAGALRAGELLVHVGVADDAPPPRRARRPRARRRRGGDAHPVFPAATASSPRRPIGAHRDRRRRSVPDAAGAAR